MAKRKKRNRGGGVPFNPDVDTGTKRPVTARVAVGDVNDKFSDYPSNGLTPRRLARIFREADEGNVRAQMELFEEMEEKDPHLFSQLQTRKNAVTGLDFGDLDGVMRHMDKQAELLRPKFAAVLDAFDRELAGKGIAEWLAPNGGYFISLDVMDGCARRVVRLCKEAGVVLTGAGATYPYKKDPRDRNIRVAPTYPTVPELEQAVELLCISVQLAAVEKLLAA